MPVTRHFNLLLVTLALTTAGCTHCQLQRNTVKTAGTISNLQYQQVLNNLAMFACNPEALPWHLKLQGGIVQVTDQATGEIGAILQSGGPNQFLPILAGQRTAVAQWQVDPAVDPDELDQLRLAYRKAIDPTDADGSIKRAIYKEVADLSATSGILLRESVLDELVAQRLQENGDDAEKQKELEKIREQIHRLFRELHESVAKSESAKERERCIAQLLVLTGELAELPFVSLPSQTQKSQSIGDVQEAQDKIKALLELVEVDPGQPNKFTRQWLCWGCKKDVPRGACLVGCYGGCYAWVMPQDRDMLREFAITVLTLAPIPSQSTSSPLVAFSPAF